MANRATVVDTRTIRIDFDTVTSVGMAFTPTQQCATHDGKLNSSSLCCTAAAGGAGMPFEVMYR